MAAADRAQHISSLIKPSLAEGKVVLCDRYFDATLVYQGFARGIDTGFIRNLHRLIFGDLKPDITFLLDLEPYIGLARAWMPYVLVAALLVLTRLPQLPIKAWLLSKQFIRGLTSGAVKG